ncbi:MAG TPA: hypothetical protein DCR93_21400 [Cytophagales bacterium]|nr:hypothetical protein [Cytophagales bacterium]
MLNLRRIPKAKFGDYFILAARLLIGWVFFSYGLSKLREGQFGLDEAELMTPLSELSPFRISWYLFDMQPFKAFIGVSQMLCGALLIWNRTLLLGAFMFLPIVATILIIDLTFMPPPMATAFAWRLSWYIVLDLLILGHYRERMLVIWKAVWDGVGTKFKHPVWVYLTLPVVAISLEVFSPRFFFYVLTRPRELFRSIAELVGQFI